MDLYCDPGQDNNRCTFPLFLPEREPNIPKKAGIIYGEGDQILYSSVISQVGEMDSSVTAWEGDRIPPAIVEVGLGWFLSDPWKVDQAAAHS